MDYVQMASRILKICNYSGGFLFFNGLVGYGAGKAAMNDFT